MGLIRYAKYAGNMPREVVLLKGLPCIWGRCTFCDYIQDNTTDEAWIQRIADEHLGQVTGEFGRLQIINSGSIQELPMRVRQQIRDLLAAKNITQFFTESYWAYRKDFARTREFFGVDTHLLLGVETFDDDLRNRVLNKSMHWGSPHDVAAVTDSICLMIGFKGQTPDIVRRDVDLLLTRFTYGIINLFTENGLSAGLINQTLKDWFREEFSWLERETNINVLWRNTDLGVG